MLTDDIYNNVGPSILIELPASDEYIASVKINEGT